MTYVHVTNYPTTSCSLSCTILRSEMRGLLLLPLVVAFVCGDTLYFQPHENRNSGVACPDRKTFCPDGQTCCASDTGEYACCPLSSAVCCSDKIHCCPMGYTCNVTTAQCQKGELTQTWTPSQKASLISGNMMCPDGQHECKDGQTCCKLASGDWGCCPLPKAVCCSDGKHCCPENTKCEVSSGKCLRGDSVIMDWFEKTPALRAQNVVCPDGQSQCRTGQTCCKLSSGQYGCCPLPKAVCCSDGKHCCPENTKCEVSSGKCMRGDSLIMDWFEKMPALRTQNVVCPDGQSQCRTGQTCCKLSSGQYGCCPLPKAVCCSDGKHCCPENTKCEVSSGKCMRGDSLIMDWFEKMPALRTQNVVCPDGQSQCKTGQTCCKLSSGQYGCCPLPKAVCCSDGKHCCPENTKCEVSSGKCLRGDSLVMDWFEKTPALRAQNVVCPDGQSQCRTGQTCCKLSSGQYGCCPLPKAVCCSDGKHCCPENTKCEVSSGKCLRGDSLIMDWFEKMPALRAQNVVCPDGQSQCRTGQTCCKLSSGQYGCCPLPKAVCCSDGKHCCPENTKCEVSSGKCMRGDSLIMDWFEKTPALRAQNVVCPDGQSQCKTGQTCCKLSSGQYGCCPLPKAVCCSDGKHCCPENTKCEVSSGKCLRGDSLIMDWFEKMPALRAQNVVCPDGQSQCRTGQTCCKLSSGQYGCCPLPKAVCCSDGKHCCPENTKCEVSSGKCLRGDSLIMDWFEKMPALRTQNVVCPDGQSQCRTGQTCCKLSSGQYGCCPLPKAVCCSDGKHCCPENTKCEVSSGKCMRGDSLIMDWFEKLPAIMSNGQGEASSVMCPDGASECEDGQTCCLLASGRYGCCPIQDAVCCSDHVHCCPQGTKCDIQQKKCIGRGVNLGTITMEMIEVKDNSSPQQPLQGFPLTALKENTVCPDGQSECKTGQTCCKLPSGMYGCCPLPKAVCCSDMKHCCPENTKCEVSSGKCLRGDSVIMDWFEKMPALRAQNVVCPDGQSQCRTGQTCCKLSSGQYGCCPLPKAVCCSDGKHCCPENTKCEVSSGKCLRGDSVIMDWFEKTPALRAQNVVCPDGQSQCRTGQTCCKLSSGQYGCCPLPKAVCCSDGKHCCPENTKCEVSSGKCLRGDSLIMDWFEKTPALRAQNVVCPDGQSQCRTGQTCCKLSSGQYGCCPLPKAVCCSDGKHCCPENTKCEVSSGKCLRGDSVIMDWFEKTPALRAQNVVCPDGQSQCKTGQTCCKLSSGQYGCCPLPKAVCCSDGKHCCPENTKCEVSSGKCLRGDSVITDWFEKTPALRAQNVVCPDGQSQCRTGQTCCKLSSGQYGCCPLPKAVCCSDGKHCCPENTKCEVSSGKCLRGDGIALDWFEKTPAQSKIPAATIARKDNSVQCPDEKTTCPDKNTCCKNKDGNFGCCAYDNAVCCKSGTYCCPKGYICDTLPEICRMPEAKEAWKNTANLFIQRILRKKLPVNHKCHKRYYL
ncbi:uncharacterized protein LOC111116042 isoform X13 [Crassostrea virginica]